MSILKFLAIFVCVLYVGFLTLLYTAQRRMMYLPDTHLIPPQAAGLPAATMETLASADGEKLVTWYLPPKEDRPLVIYFQGNAGQIADRARRFRILARNGNGVLAVSYRGYGGSTGTPTESGLIADARAAYTHALAKGIPPRKIVLFGESLGTGVAVALAAEKDIAALVLEAPFSSTADVGASIYWMFPVRLLLKDQFRSVSRITRVRAPLLIVHGDADRVIPIGFGRKLFDAAREPKSFLAVPEGGHQVLEEQAVANSVHTWLEKTLSSHAAQ